MSKPQWLKDREADVRKITVDPYMCFECLYYGPFVKFSKYRGRERVEVHSCDVHPGCLNTKYSICCEDFAMPELV